MSRGLNVLLALPNMRVLQELLYKESVRSSREICSRHPRILLQ